MSDPTDDLARIVPITRSPEVWETRLAKAEEIPTVELLPGTLVHFGDYELHEEIARGGMGVVYKARHTRLNRIVALKMILAGQFAGADEILRFSIEAKAAAGLDHPNIVSIYEVGELEGRNFFSMKFVDGESLAKQAPRFLDDARYAARLMVKLSRAMHFAHQHDILHRDLKPANVLLDRHGEPYITDFGLAKHAHGDSGLTHSGTVMGTPSYMPPEQAAGRIRSLTPTADIYSLGAILYHLLAGRPPFLAATIAETLAQVLKKEPVPPRLLRPKAPKELELICLKCLEKDPGKRYQSADVLVDDLERYLRGDSVQVGRTAVAARLQRSVRRSPELACRFLVMTAILVLTQVNYLLNPRPDRRLHLEVTTIEVAWILSTFAFGWISRLLGSPDPLRPAWIALDLAILTSLLWALNAVQSSLVIGYAAVIATSGLWNRVRLVWLSTGMAMVAYAVLVVDALIRKVPLAETHHPNIVLSALAVTGFIVAHLVRRIWALSGDN